MLLFRCLGEPLPIRKNQQLLNTRMIVKRRVALIRQKRTFSMPQLIRVSFSNGENLPL